MLHMPYSFVFFIFRFPHVAYFNFPCNEKNDDQNYAISSLVVKVFKKFFVCIICFFFAKSAKNSKNFFFCSSDRVSSRYIVFLSFSFYTIFYSITWEIFFLNHIHWIFQWIYSAIIAWHATSIFSPDFYLHFTISSAFRWQLAVVGLNS